MPLILEALRWEPKTKRTLSEELDLDPHTIHNNLHYLETTQRIVFDGAHPLRARLHPMYKQRYYEAKP